MLQTTNQYFSGDLLGAGIKMQHDSMARVKIGYSSPIIESKKTSQPKIGGDD